MVDHGFVFVLYKICCSLSQVQDSSAESGCDDECVPDDEPNSGDGFTSNDNKRRQNAPHSAEPKPKKRLKQQSIGEDGADGSPSFTNRNFCFVCGKAQTKISRHLRTHRKENAEIAEVFALRRRSKKRIVLLEKLRNRGNYQNNKEVLKTRCGELKVRRVVSDSPITAKTFAPCIYCKGLYFRKEMWRHMQKCTFNNFPGAASVKILTYVADSVTDPHKVPPNVEEIFKTLRNDEVSTVVKGDFYILQLAQCLCLMNERKNKNWEYIKHKLRQMGRLLLILKKKSVCSLEDAMKPENFGTIVDAVRELAGLKEGMKSCDRRSILLTIGDSLKKIGDIKYARALKEDADKETIQEAAAFMALCTKEWSIALPPKPRDDASPVTFTQNVQLLYKFMETTAASASNTLLSYETPPVYKALLHVTVAQLSVLNKNMLNVSKATLQSFKERKEAELQADAAAQSQLEQILCRRLVKINLMKKSGKKGREGKVVVLMTPEIISALTLLVSKRDACGVNANNPFLFGIPASVCTNFYRGHTCFRIIVARCGVKDQETLKSPLFRKHMIRIFQILSLTNDELEQLGKLLGRDIRMDGEFYQTPEAAGYVAKILQLISAVESGSLERFEGKSMEEIEIEGVCSVQHLKAAYQETSLCYVHVFC